MPMSSGPASGPRRRRARAESETPASKETRAPSTQRTASKTEPLSGPVAEAPPAAKAPLGGDLLKAGLKALGDVRGEVVTRHSRFFEALLGVDAKTGARKAKELFTLPTFENLFDERVARSLERLGTAQALAELRAQIVALDERLQRLEPRQEPRAPRSKR
jgi:hypothetical protein